MHPNCRRGSLPNIRGSRLSAVPFCISILTSVRRIIKIAVRFLHTKTALCDRKDTQSRFAVNAARSIVCVETSYPRKFNVGRGRFQCRTQHCVCRDINSWELRLGEGAFQCRTQHCVCRDKNERYYGRDIVVFQCRTQHCVCRDLVLGLEQSFLLMFQCRTQHCVCRDAFAPTDFTFQITGFNAARSIVCVETRVEFWRFLCQTCFNAARSIVCVETVLAMTGEDEEFGFQCRTQHCVCRDHA